MARSLGKPSGMLALGAEAFDGNATDLIRELV